MSAYKQLLSSDVIITPFEVNKAFTFEGAPELTASDAGIDRFIGTNDEIPTYTTSSWQSTGEVAEELRVLVYNSVKKLYYGNYVDNVGTSTAASGGYDNSLPTDLYYERFFPTGDLDQVGVVSIPTKLYGDKIQPKSFLLKSGSISITDDGEGNLKLGSLIVGNIFYNQGVAVIIGNGNNENDGGALYGTAVYGTSVYGATEDVAFISNFISDNDVTCSFSSSYQIFETQYKCTIDANEFNYSVNPSLLADDLRGNDKILTSGSSQYSNFVTSSDFSPFVTTIGLYNDDKELVAVGKLSQPLPTSQTTDTTIFINIDR